MHVYRPSFVSECGLSYFCVMGMMLLQYFQVVFNLQLTLPIKWIRALTACTQQLVSDLPPGGHHLVLTQHVGSHLTFWPSSSFAIGINRAVSFSFRSLIQKAILTFSYWLNSERKSFCLKCLYLCLYLFPSIPSLTKYMHMLYVLIQ